MAITDEVLNELLKDYHHLRYKCRRRVGGFIPGWAPVVPLGYLPKRDFPNPPTMPKIPPPAVQHHGYPPTHKEETPYPFWLKYQRRGILDLNSLLVRPSELRDSARF